MKKESRDSHYDVTQDPKFANSIYEALGFNKRERIINPYGFFERIFSPPKDELGKPLKFKKNKVMKGPMYRVVRESDWDYAQKVGMFRKSLKLKRDEKVMEKLKKSDKDFYKKIIYGDNSANFTRVSPHKNYALNMVRNPKDLIIEFKPIKNKLRPSTEYGNYNELFAQNLSLGDVATVTDLDGNIVYQSTNNNQNFPEKMKREAESLYEQYRKNANSKIGSKEDLEGFKKYLKENKNSLESKILNSIFGISALVGIFFLSPDLTGNVIGNMTRTGSSVLGIILVVFGLLGIFLNGRN